MVVPALESTENTLRRAQDLLEKVERQNDIYPGAGATIRDISQAKMLLQEMVVILSELTSQVLADIDNDQGFTLAKEAQQAFDKAASLISSIYNDIRKAHAALEDGTTQSPSIQQVEIHLERLVKHCRQAREHLLMDYDSTS